MEISLLLFFSYFSLFQCTKTLFVHLKRKRKSVNLGNGVFSCDQLFFSFLPSIFSHQLKKIHNLRSILTKFILTFRRQNFLNQTFRLLEVATGTKSIILNFFLLKRIVMYKKIKIEFLLQKLNQIPLIQHIFERFLI